MELNADVKAIKKLMVDMNFNTIADLATASGVDRNTLSSILAGKAQPSSRVMEKLADALKISPEECGRIFFAQKIS